MATEYEPDPDTPGAHILHLPNGQSVRTASPERLLRKAGATPRPSLQPGLQQLDRVGHVNQPVEQAPELNQLAAPAPMPPKVSYDQGDVSAGLAAMRSGVDGPPAPPGTSNTSAPKKRLLPVTGGAPVIGPSQSLWDINSRKIQAAAGAELQALHDNIGRVTGSAPRRLPAEDRKLGFTTRSGPQVSQEMLDASADVSINKKLAMQQSADQQEAALDQQAKNVFSHEVLPAIKAVRDAKRDIAELDAKNAKIEQERSNLQGARQLYQHRIDTGEIDPNRFFKNQSTAAAISGWIGMIAGGLIMGMRGGPNPMLEFYKQQVANDIAAQEADLEKNKFQLSQVDNELARLVDMTGSIERAKGLLYDLQMAAGQARLKEASLRAQSSSVQTNLQEAYAIMDVERNKEIQSLLLQEQGETTTSYKHIPERTVGGFRRTTTADFLKKAAPLMRYLPGPQKVDGKQARADRTRIVRFSDGSIGYADRTKQAADYTEQIRGYQKALGHVRALDKAEADYKAGKISISELNVAKKHNGNALLLANKQLLQEAMSEGERKILEGMGGEQAKISLTKILTGPDSKYRARLKKTLHGYEAQIKRRVTTGPTNNQTLIPRGVKRKK